jgi:hypothetical protein
MFARQKPTIKFKDIPIKTIFFPISELSWIENSGGAGAITVYCKRDSTTALHNYGDGLFFGNYDINTEVVVLSLPL